MKNKKHITISYSRIDLSTPYGTEVRKSRRDGILLTVGFNPRTGNAVPALRSPVRTIYDMSDMPSLRDFSPQILYHDKLLISHF